MGLFSKLFGGKSSSNDQYKSPKDLAHQVLDGTLKRGDFDISFDLESSKEDNRTTLTINMFGEEEKAFTAKDGALLDAFQLFLKRSIQHHFSDESVNVIVDCGGFREKANQSLMELADRLMNKALEQGKSVYLRALPPKDRKVIHQHLAEDGRVKSRSVGDGLYKKIKIYPVQDSGSSVNGNGQVH